MFAIKFVDDYSSMPLEAKRKEPEDKTGTEPSKAKTKRKNSHQNCIRNLSINLKLMKKYKSSNI